MYSMFQCFYNQRRTQCVPMPFLCPALQFLSRWRAQTIEFSMTTACMLMQLLLNKVCCPWIWCQVVVGKLENIDAGVPKRFAVKSFCHLWKAKSVKRTVSFRYIWSNYCSSVSLKLLWLRTSLDINDQSCDVLSAGDLQVSQTDFLSIIFTQQR